MKKKQYIYPVVEVLAYQVKNVLKTGSDLPPDPAPRRRTAVF